MSKKINNFLPRLSIHQTRESYNEISNEALDDIVNRSKHSLSTILYRSQESKKQYKENRLCLMEKQQRKWMAKHGKGFLLHFNQQERQKMKGYFQVLDKKNKGSLGIDQLYQLFISVGLAETRQDVKKLISSVDSDGSGKIEFDQFLQIIQSDGLGQNQALIKFFKNMINGTIDKDISPGLELSLAISNVRRKKMMNGLEIKKTVSIYEKKEGMKVMNAFRSMKQKINILRIIDN